MSTTSQLNEHPGSKDRAAPVDAERAARLPSGLRQRRRRPKYLKRPKWIFNSLKRATTSEIVSIPTKLVSRPIVFDRALSRNGLEIKPPCGTCGGSKTPRCALSRALSRAEPPASAIATHACTCLWVTDNGLIETPGRRLTTGAQLRTLPTTKLGAAPRNAGRQRVVERVERVERAIQRVGLAPRERSHD